MKRYKKKKNKKINKKKVLIVIIGLLIIISVIFQFCLKKSGNDDLKENDQQVFDGKIFYVLEKDDLTNHVKISFTIKSDNGIKKVFLPDGSFMDYDNQNQVKFEYTVDRNGEYFIQVIDSDGNIGKESIEITAISE